jgi:hypothetical protein
MGATVAGAQIGCSQGPGGSSLGGPGSAQGDNVGSVGMHLTLPGGEEIQTIAWTITGPSGTSTVVQTGTVAVQNSAAISFLVGNLPSGTNFTIALSGTSTDGSVTCAGSAQFNVVARTTTKVSVALQCNTTVSQTGSTLVNGTTYDCASVNFVTANPAETTVGNSIALSASAAGPNAGALTYAWSTSSGAFDAPNSAQANFMCASSGAVTLTLTVGDGPVPQGSSCNPTLDSAVIQVQCDSAPSDAGGASDASVGASDATSDASTSDVTTDTSSTDATGDASTTSAQALVTTIDPGSSPIAVTINQGTAIGEGALNGATPFTLTNLAADPKNTQTITSAVNPFLATGTVPDTAAGFCNYSGPTPTRVSYVTGAKFETTAPGTAGADPMEPMAPFYFPLVYNTTNTTVGNGFGGQPPIIGLFDWRPKDIDEALVAAESDDNGKTWFFMQTVLELNPDYTNPISGGFSPTATSTGCPASIGSTNANFTSANGSQADDGWGHAAILQLPGAGNVKTGQFLYMLDRNTNNIPGTTTSIVDGAPLWVINLTQASNKFPIWNTNSTGAGNNDIKSISSALTNTAGSTIPVVVQQTVGLSDPDGIMAVFPTSPSASTGSAVTVLYVQKILSGDDTGATALPISQRCAKAPFSGKTNDDISNVRLATTTDGVHFTDLGVVNGLNDPTTVDYNKTRWISPRATLLDINGDGSRWGMYFSGGNCLDGDSDAFHYIGYAESTDMMNWVVYNDINHPIASINTITTVNQSGGASVTIPANPPLVPTQPWFAERLYAPTATQVDSTHLSMTFAGYGVQTPNNDLLDYREIGNVVLTVSKALPAGVPNNINTH